MGRNLKYFLLLALLVSTISFVYSTLISSGGIELFKIGKQTSSEDLNFLVPETPTYIEDPDLGRVSGSRFFNSTAEDFYNRFHRSSSEPAKSISLQYAKFEIVSLQDNNISLMDLRSRDAVSLVVSCQKDKTALFKRLNIEFVSSGFEFAEEARAGDILYASCSSAPCESIGPECILIR